MRYHSPAVPTEVVVSHLVDLDLGLYGLSTPVDKTRAHDSKTFKFLSKQFVFRGKIYLRAIYIKLAIADARIPGPCTG